MLMLTDAATKDASIFTKDSLNVQDMVVGGRLTKKVRAKNPEFNFLTL